MIDLTRQVIREKKGRRVKFSLLHAAKKIGEERLDSAVQGVTICERKAQYDKDRRKI